MNDDEFWGLLARLRETARQLRDIGEAIAAEDIETLIRLHIEALGGGPS